jgi:hypothetical protein
LGVFLEQQRVRTGAAFCRVSAAVEFTSVATILPLRSATLRIAVLPALTMIASPDS